MGDIATEKRQQAEQFVLNGMSQQDLEASLLDLFTAADTDGSGQIGLKELRGVLEQLVKPGWMQLDDSELNFLLYNLDTDGNGQLSFAEFLPMAFDMLVTVVIDMHDFEEQMVEEEMEEEMVRHAEEVAMATDIASGAGMTMDQLQFTLEKLFLAHDKDGNGVLDQSEFVLCMIELIRNDGGIDRKVGAEIFRAIDMNGDGLVEWKEFVGPAVRIIHSTMNAEDAEEVFEDATLEKRRQEASEAILSTQTQAELEDTLKGLFEDVDQDASGTVDMKELRAVLTKLNVDVSDAELNNLLFKLDVNSDGRLSVEEFLPVAFEMLVNTVMELREWDN